jgi:HPt (histidine-containing phosphotransfer) domain-containing protein
MPTIDPGTFNELKLNAGADFMPELIDTFLDDAPRMLADLRAALDAGGAELFRRTAHSLKSNAQTFGALGLAGLARDLEMIGRENRLADAGPKLDELAAEYAQVATALKGLRDG